MTKLKINSDLNNELASNYDERLERLERMEEFNQKWMQYQQKYNKAQKREYLIRDLLINNGQNDQYHVYELQIINIKSFLYFYTL